MSSQASAVSDQEAQGREMTMVEALRAALREEMRRDDRVILLGEDIGVEGGFGGAFTVTLGLSEEFGHHRVLDTPISEAAIAGVAAGQPWADCGRWPTSNTATFCFSPWTSWRIT